MKKNIIFTILVFIAYSSFSQENLSKNNYEIDNILMQQVWFNTNNPTSTLSITDKINSAKLQFNSLSLDNKNYNEPSKTNNYNFSINTFTNINNYVYFYGIFEFQRQNENNISNNFFPKILCYSPFYAGDSINRNLKNEFYHFYGCVAKDFLNKKLDLAIDVDYLSGTSAAQKDPRPENDFLFFTVKPAIKFKTENFTFGFDLNYRTTNNVFSTIIEIDEHYFTYYFYKGLGFREKEFTNTSSSDYIRKGDKLGYDFQFEFNLFNTSNIIEASYYSFDEETTKGVSYIPQNAIYQKFTGLNYSNFIKFNNKTFSNLLIKIGDKETQNIIYETTQENIADGGTVYVVSGKFKSGISSIKSIDLDYKLNKIDDYFFDIKSSLIKSEFEYYVIPETFTKAYTNFNFSFEANKILTFHKFNLNIGIGGLLKKNIDNNLKVDESIFNTDFSADTKSEKLEMEYQKLSFYGSTLNFTLKYNLTNNLNLFFNTHFDSYSKNAFKIIGDNYYLSSSLGINF